MKALTIWQPHASLIAVGAKKIEGRSWAMSYRGRLAIHAAASSPHHRLRSRVGLRLGEWACHMLPGQKWLLWRPDENGLRIGKEHYASAGAIVATCELVDVVRTEAVGQTMRDDWHGWLQYVDGGVVAGKEQFKFGDLSPGRFAWLLDDIQPLDPPVPAKGQQGLWEWKAEEVSA